ncbi:MAG: hypothetical protein QOF60_2318 [Actinomycetota bacterium]|nr:hypothetical protein [Actinomycetota bacterium]
MSAPPWWSATSPAEAELACGGKTHTVRWERGGLVLAGHDDVEAERALGALGASPPACLVLRERWERHAGDVALLTLGRRPGEASLGCAEDVRLTSTTRRAELLALLALPAPMIDRLVMTAAAQAADRWADDGFRQAHGLRLGAALKARATPALRRLGEGLVPGAEVVVECRPTGPGEPPEIVAEHRPPDPAVHVDATLPLEWLASVWGPGISEPDGRVVLQVVDGDDDTFTVDLASWEATAPDRWRVVAERATLTRSLGRWST